MVVSQLMNAAGRLNPNSSYQGAYDKKASFAGDVIPKGYRAGQLQQFTPEQMDLLQNSYGYVSPQSDLARMAQGDQSYYSEMEAPALRQFQGMLDNLGSRFSMGSGRGSLGTRQSSGFQQAGVSALSNFAQDLASKRQELRSQALRDLMGYSQMLLGQRPYERTLQQKEEKPALGGWGSVLGGIGGGLAGAFVPGLGPIAGAAMGSSAFSGL